MKVNVNLEPKPAPTHWSNAFGFRRRETATADKNGKVQASIPSALLALIGVNPGDDVICEVTNNGAIIVRKPEIQVR